MLRMNLVYRQGRSTIAAKLQSSLCTATTPRQQRVEKSFSRIALLESGANEKESGDRWHARGAGGVWVREHCTPREALFTPCRVARGPAHPDLLSHVRVTRGRFVDGGDFVIKDSWRSSAAHALLFGQWVGTTTFQKAQEELSVSMRR